MMYKRQNMKVKKIKSLVKLNNNKLIKLMFHNNPYNMNNLKYKIQVFNISILDISYKWVSTQSKNNYRQKF